MTGLTRRQFLKRAGLLGAAITTPAVPSLRKLPTTVETAARAFSLTPVYAKPETTSEIVGQLAPDSVHDAVQVGEWYRVDSGYVARQAMQPIVPYARPELMDGTGFWAELVAPMSAVRKWCAGHAPIVTRLGFGAVVYVVDRLVDGAGQVWYGLAADEESELVGWGIGLHFSEALTPSPADAPLCVPTGIEGRKDIKIDTRNSVLSVYEQRGMIGEMEIYSPIIEPVKTNIRAVKPGAVIDIHAPLGLPWLMELETGQRVHGAFWHNRFGSVSQSKAIELPPLTARYLYGLVQNSVEVEIV